MSVWLIVALIIIAIYVVGFLGFWAWTRSWKIALLWFIFVFVGTPVQ